MADHKLSNLLKTQVSLTEWLESIGHKDAAMLRVEDNNKLARIDALHRIINLPCAIAEVFDGQDVTLKNERFKKIMNTRGQELCAFRLAPKKPGIPKLRNRGNTIEATYEWFKQQAIEPADYQVQIMPHDDTYQWAAIFVVNKNGIFGEIYYGNLGMLTQGFYEDNPPIVFSYDFKKWLLSPKNDAALSYLKKLVKCIKVTDAGKRTQITSELGSTFSNSYLNGYFETSDSSIMGTWFCDYSIKLGEIYQELHFKEQKSDTAAIVSGQIGCSGIATGRVKVVEPSGVDSDFKKGSVLVCKVTTPDFVPIMMRACAIVTDQGGILSHAAIVARELKIPCIVGTKNATTMLQNGQLVRVNANNGSVTTC